MIHVKDAEGPLKIGETYLVDVCRIERADNIEFVVMDCHKGEYSDELHHHVDPRFVTDDDIAKLKNLGLDWNPHEIMAIEPAEVFQKERVCIRELDFDPLLSYMKDSVFLKLKRNLLEYNHRYYVLNKTCLRCPHQEMNLKTVSPVIIDGKPVLVCPNHKLAWDVESGKNVNICGPYLDEYEAKKIEALILERHKK